MARARRDRLLLATTAALAAACVSLWFAPHPLAPLGPRAVIPLRPASPELVFAPTGPLLATYNPDPDSYRNGRSLLFWDSITGRPVADLNEPGAALRSVAFSPDGRSIAAIVGGEVWEWDSRGGVWTRRRAYPLPESDPAASRIAYDRRGQLVVIGRPRRGVPILDPRTGGQIVRVIPPPDSESLEAVPGNLLASAGGNTLHLYDLATGSPLADVSLDGGELRDFSYAQAPGVLVGLTPHRSPRDGPVRQAGSGRFLPTWDVLVWERATGRTRTLLAGGTYARPTVSPDGLRVAVTVDAPTVKRPAWLDQLRSWVGLKAGNDRPYELRVCDVATGREQVRFPGTREGYFSPDGKSLAVVSSQIEVYDLPFRPQLAPVVGLALVVGAATYLLTGVRLFRLVNQWPGPSDQRATGSITG